MHACLLYCLCVSSRGLYCPDFCAALRLMPVCSYATSAIAKWSMLSQVRNSDRGRGLGEGEGEKGRGKATVLSQVRYNDSRRGQGEGEGRSGAMLRQMRCSRGGGD